MNSIILYCVGLLCLANFGQSALSWLPDARNSDYPGKCVTTFAQEQIIINPGETITEKKTCTRVSCNQKFQMKFATCGKIAGYPSECWLSDVDQSKDYPDCCPDIECPKNPNSL